MSQEIVRFKDVSFSYGERPVLEDVSFDVHEDEFFALIGPNAGGKSTVLKLILGLLKPDRGTIEVFGGVAEDARTRIGYVPQRAEFSQRFPISVRDMVMLGRLGTTRAIGGFNARDRQRVAAVLEAVEIADIAAQPLGTLSGGQMQRALIARALVSDPELLVLDEPTANIDIRAEEDLFSLLRQYRTHMTIIVVSHDVAFISGYVDRVGCLNKTLVCHGTESINSKSIEELYGAPVRRIFHEH
jgi:zinc transport system ATP-binding protein